MKHPIDIEQLLVWAVMELTNRDVSSAEANWKNISAYGDRGGVAIGGGSSPQRYAAIAAPHPDALVVEQAIKGLAGLMGGAGGMVTIDYANSRPILFGEGVALAPRAMALRPYNIAVIVTSMARLNKRPTWNVGLIRPQRTLGSNGKPVVEGINKTTRRPDPGAHCPLTWTPSMREIAETRGEYLLWHRALVELSAALADSLVAHVPTFPQAPQTPWIDTPDAQGRREPKLLITPQVISAIHEGRKKRGLHAV